MKLRHFSHKIVTDVRGSRQVAKHYLGFGPKPKGFWISDESDHGWYKWSTGENFRRFSLRFEHEIVLSDKAKILYLRSAKDIDDFADKYQSTHPMSANSIVRNAQRRMEDRRVFGGDYVYDIDWKRVSQKYHGIIITPYIWEQRLGRHMWYYGWDCASGCIWNARAIESITMIRERISMPKKPTYWQERRAAKRHREKMIAMSKKLEEMTKNGPNPFVNPITPDKEKEFINAG